MTKELFIHSIEALHKQYLHDDKCAEAFKVILPNDYTTLYDNHHVIDALTKILVDATNDTSDWISYFIYELNFGKDWKDGMIKENGKDIKLQTTEDLWNLLAIE